MNRITVPSICSNVDFDASLEVAIGDHLKRSMPPQALRELRRSFGRDDYVELTDVVPAYVTTAVERETTFLLDGFAQRCDVSIAVTGDSRRRYAYLRRDTIAEHGVFIPAIYRSDCLLQFLGEVLGEEIARVPYVPEEFVVTRMEREGDTHGWHWDDYGYALVWVVTAAPEELGGSTELVRGVAWDKENPRVEHFLATRPLERHHPKSGSLYLLKADTTLHRVAPVRAGARREIICYSYASREELDREVTHETVDGVYGTLATDVASVQPMT